MGGIIIKYSLTRIIKKSVKNIINKYGNSYPRIIDYTYYGEYNKNPNLLTIIYIFETNSDLIFAENNHLIEKLRNETIKELVSNGYPENAFNKQLIYYNTTDNFNNLNKFEELFIYSLENPFVRINFISDESVQDEADGNLFLYLK